MKNIEAVKPTTSNGSHVETSSSISRSSRIAPLRNAKVTSSFPGAREEEAARWRRPPHRVPGFHAFP